TLEESFQIIERIDRYTLTSNLAFRERIIGVVSHEGWHVEVHRQPGLSLGEQIAKSLIGIRSGAVTGNLAHCPGSAAIHRGIWSADKWILARKADVFKRDGGDIFGCIHGL